MNGNSALMGLAAAILFGIVFMHYLPTAQPQPVSTRTQDK